MRIKLTDGIMRIPAGYEIIAGEPGSLLTGGQSPPGRSDQLILFLEESSQPFKVGAPGRHDQWDDLASNLPDMDYPLVFSYCQQLSGHLPGNKGIVAEASAGSGQIAAYSSPLKIQR